MIYDRDMGGKKCNGNFDIIEDQDNIGKSNSELLGNPE